MEWMNPSAGLAPFRPAGESRKPTMRGGLSGPRVLLRRLREVMAEPISAQERLDKIVVTIAANMVAEVCSLYVLRADGVLELFATEGLNREAVHKASLRVGQGLVGLIAAEAAVLNLADAQEHPAFSYIPGTDEEAFYKAKLQTARFYFQRILPRTRGLVVTMLSGANNLMDMAEEDFALGY